MGWVKIRTLALISAGVASLSILTAGISGIPFGALLFRALLSALIAAVVTLGISWLIQRFLPELLQEEQGADSSARGGNIDITVNQGDDDVGPQVIGPQVPYQETPDNSVENDEPELEEVSGGSKIPVTNTVPEQGFQETGKLPDIESFSSDFNPGGDSGEVPKVDSGDEPKGDDGIGKVEQGSRMSSGIVSSDDQAKEFFKTSSSPEEMAKAIRTIVKRDEN